MAAQTNVELAEFKKNEKRCARAKCAAWCGAKRSATPGALILSVLAPKHAKAALTLEPNPENLSNIS